MKPKYWIPKFCNLTLVDSEEKLLKLAEEIKLSTHVSLDLETTGLDWLSDKIVGIAISPALDQGYYIPICHADSKNMNLDKVRETLKPILQEKTVVFYNASFDKSFLRKVDMDVPNYEDSMLLIFHFNTEKYKAFGLKAASKEFLNREMIEFYDLFTPEEQFLPLKKGGLSKQRRKDLNIKTKTAEHCLQYACSDAINTLQLWAQLRHKLPKSQEKVLEIDTKYIEYIIDMQDTGFCVDVKYLENLEILIDEQIEKLAKEMDELAGQTVRPKSAASVWSALEKFDIKPTKLTASGKPAIDAKTMAQIDHPIIQKIMQQKKLETIKSTFLEPLLAGNHSVTGRCHSMYNSNFVVTGRLSSNKHPTAGGVNIQQVAKEIIVDKKDPLYSTFEGMSIRAAIKPPEGFEQACADLSAAELRIAAHISKEPIWIAEFAKGPQADLHQALCDNINSRIPGLGMTRAKAKNAQFNLLYAFYWKVFAENQGISMDEAESIYKAFFGTVTTYAKWREHYKMICRDRGYSETLAGRRRVITNYERAKALDVYVKSITKKPKEMWTPEERDIVRKRASYYAAGDRESINHAIQGTCLDMIKIAGIKYRNAMIAKGVWLKTVFPGPCVHDEMNMYFKGKVLDSDNIDNLIEMHQIMETPIFPNFRVPVISEVEVGSNWNDLEKVQRNILVNTERKITNVNSN